MKENLLVRNINAKIWLLSWTWIVYRRQLIFEKFILAQSKIYRVATSKSKINQKCIFTTIPQKWRREKRKLNQCQTHFRTQSISHGSGLKRSSQTSIMFHWENTPGVNFNQKNIKQFKNKMFKAVFLHLLLLDKLNNIFFSSPPPSWKWFFNHESGSNEEGK